MIDILVERDNWDTSSVTDFAWNILRCDLVHGRWIVKLGYVECDDFVWNILRCDLVHGRFVKLGYVECDEFGETFYGATSFTGDGLSNWDTSSVTDLYGNSRHAIRRE